MHNTLNYMGGEKTKMSDSDKQIKEILKQYKEYLEQLVETH
jgi:hypothetical protein